VKEVAPPPKENVRVRTSINDEREQRGARWTMILERQPKGPQPGGSSAHAAGTREYSAL